MEIPLGRWKILLVEENEADFSAIHGLLMDGLPGRFELNRVAAPSSALVALDQFAPDVLLMAIDFTHTAAGQACLRAARERSTPMPAILLCPHDSQSAASEAARSGAADFLAKDQLSAPLLVRVISYTIERQQMLLRLNAANMVLENGTQERTRMLQESNRALADANRALAKANQALRSTNDLFEHIFSSIHLHIAYLDRDFNFIRVNRNYAEASGRPEDFFPGKNHFELFPDAENEAIFRRVVAVGEAYYVFARPFNNADRLKNGITYWDWSLQPVKDASGQVTGLILSLLNVTEQHRANQALNYQGYLLDSVNDAILAMDMNFRYTSWNRAAEMIYGWKREEALGRRDEELIRTEHVGSSDSNIFQILLEIGNYQCEAYQTCKDGRRILVEIKATLLKDEAGSPTGIITINRDITLRRQAEGHLRQVNARLEAQSRLSTELGEAGLEIPRILDILARRVADLIGDSCMVTRLDEGGQRHVLVASHHFDPEGDRLMQQFVQQYPQQISALVPVTIQQSLLIPYLLKEELYNQLPEELRLYLNYFAPHSILVVPIKVNGRLIGTLSLSRDQTDSPYTIEDQYFLEGLASLAALWIANAELYQAVQVELAERRRIEGELNEIQRRLIDGAEAERLSLARELHDGPIQDLYGIGMQLRQLAEKVASEDTNDTFLELHESVQRIVDTLRAMTMELRPPSLTRFGLESAIHSHVEQVRKMQPALEIRMDLDSDSGTTSAPSALSERLRLTLYRIYQVAITNVLRHAQARHVTIRLRINPAEVLLEIEDDGRGFQVPEHWVELARQGHLGLVGIIERVDALGGRLQVTSVSGGGTLLQAVLPR